MSRIYNPYPVSYLGRENCYVCFRPAEHCVCNLVQPFTAFCHLLILQHPREKRKYYGTTKIIRAAVKNSNIVVGERFAEKELSSALNGRKPYLLFPGPNSIPCNQVVLDHNNSLIILDGTWSEAKKIFLRSPCLQSLPQLSFQKEYTSAYKIRKQPKIGCLSTLEAFAIFLSESAKKLDGKLEQQQLHSSRELLSAFETMVDRQIQYWPSRRLKMSQTRAFTKNNCAKSGGI